MLLLNGERRHCIDASDRGLQYGDGVFETIEILNDKALFLKQHLARLALGCNILQIPCPDFELLTAEVGQMTANTKLGVVKLIVTRGSGGRGYRQPPAILPSRLISLHPHPDYPSSFRHTGVNVRICSKRLAINPDLARIKHLNRLEQVMARAEWQDDDIHEGLMLDREQHVIEGTMSNLFMVKNDTLHTPLLDNCGIAGIVRSVVMAIAGESSIPLLERELDLETVFSADELFVTNSIIGIWPVKRLEHKTFKVGTVTKRLQALYDIARNAELAA